MNLYNVPVCLPVYLSIYLCMYLSIYLSIYLPIYLAIRASVHPSNYLSKDTAISDMPALIMDVLPHLVMQFDNHVQVMMQRNLSSF